MNFSSPILSLSLETREATFVLLPGKIKHAPSGSFHPLGMKMCRGTSLFHHEEFSDEKCFLHSIWKI